PCDPPSFPTRRSSDLWGLHIRLDLTGAAQLILRLLIGEAALKVVLPVGVRRKGKPFDLGPLGIELDELIGHICHGLFHPLAGLRSEEHTSELQSRFDL